MAVAGTQQDDYLWDSEVMVDPAHLEIGHFVSRMDRPWLGTPFSLKGVLLKKKKQIDWMRQHCEWVVIDFWRSENRQRPPGWDVFRKAGREREFSGYLGDEEAAINVLRRARIDAETSSASIETHSLLRRQAKELIRSIHEKGQIDSTETREVISGLADELEHNLAAMVWLTRIKETDEYTAQHCVNVAILAMGLARALDWEREQIEVAGLAGMLHDLGKTRVDSQLLRKPGRLTAEEYEQVKLHVRYGHELLRNDPDIPTMVAKAVLEHHERPDGLGYLKGLRGPQIQPLSALISVVDAYDAITSHRPYSKPRSHHEALGILWKERGGQFDRGMVEAFIQFLGWVTPGTLVRLNDERHAIVVRSSHQHRLYPLVRLLTSDDEEGYRVGEALDLYEYNQQHPEQALRIDRVLADDAVELDFTDSLDKIGRQASV